jgi:hypothetical protein
MKHSTVVGGSTAKRVMNCPGSVALVQLAPPSLKQHLCRQGHVAAHRHQ